MKTNMNRFIFAAGISAAWLFAAASAFAHCDTLDGPVVADARTALEKKEVTPVLKWIKPEHAAELETAFNRTLAVRPQSKEARELADQFFFETLVRLHREGEGAPYTGLQPAGAELDSGIAVADKALVSGNADAAVKAVTEAIAEGMRQRFEKAVEKKKHAEHNVEAGREYVAAYVEFIHYVEALHTIATRDHVHGQSESTAKPATAASEHNH